MDFGKEKRSRIAGTDRQPKDQPNISLLAGSAVSGTQDHTGFRQREEVETAKWGWGRVLQML